MATDTLGIFDELDADRPAHSSGSHDGTLGADRPGGVDRALKLSSNLVATLLECR